MRPCVILALVIFALASATGAASPQGGPSPEMILQRMDSDHDGRISRQEWRGPPPRFGRMDFDHDGFLTRSELERGIATGPAFPRNRQEAIDVHAHIHAHPDSSRSERQNYDYRAAADSAIERMDASHIRMSVIMPPPGIVSRPGDENGVLEQVRRYRGRFAALCGGSTLNPIIHRTPPGKVTEKIKRQFTARAEKLLRDGATGFGEMATLHFSFFTYHPFEEAPPDHPLFLLLADIAARHDVPIDLHNEIVLKDMAVPAELLKRSKRNPARVRENLSGFERLLSHNSKARIILSHSMDSTGGRKADVIRGLFERHANLYMSLNVLPAFAMLQNLPLKGRGGIAPDWLQLVKDYPDRFLMGSDQFHIAPCAGCKTYDSLTPTLRWLALLPPGIARAIALENPRRVFKLD